MKMSTVLLFFMLAIAFQTKSQSIYSLNIPALYGGNIELSAFAGKKIMFVIAPVSDFDSLKLKDLRNFQAANQSKVQVVGILSNEHGYHDSLKSKITALYQRMQVSIPLTAGMYTTKSNVSSQGNIANWLTQKSQNKLNDEDIEGIFQKFLVSKNGKLTNVFNAYTLFTSPAVKSSIQMP